MKEVTHPQFLYQIASEERSQDLFEVALNGQDESIFNPYNPDWSLDQPGLKLYKTIPDGTLPNITHCKGQ